MKLFDQGEVVVEVEHPRATGRHSKATARTVLATGSRWNPWMIEGSGMTSAKSSPLIVPPFLEPGDTIGIATPASPYDREPFEAGLTILRQWGYAPSRGAGASGKKVSGGSDAERAAEVDGFIPGPGNQGHPLRPGRLWGHAAPGPVGLCGPGQTAQTLHRVQRHHRSPVGLLPPSPPADLSRTHGQPPWPG